MRKVLFTVISAVFCISCGLDAPEPNVYAPFRCVEEPENRVYYPEEKLVFKFNSDVNPNSVASGFSVSSENVGKLESIVVSGDTVTVLPPLPAEDNIFITMTSALKSSDNRPLMTGEQFSENKEIRELLYETGKKLPEVAEIIPDDSRSMTAAVRFDSAVEIKFSDIEPKPEDMMKLDEWYVFLFSKTVDSFTVKKAKSAERDYELENVKIELPSNEPEKSEVSFDSSVTDTTFSLSVTGDSVIALALENSYFICRKGCTAVLDGLEAEKNYEVNAEVWTKTGKVNRSFAVETDEASPHIMISEIMHTPSLEPQKSWEFVEIYNYSAMDFDLSNCFIDDKNDGKGVDPLSAKNEGSDLILRSGEVAVVTGNEAAFGDILPPSALWLIVDDTTIADSGLTGNESVQILCDIDGVRTIVAEADPGSFKTDKGFSFTADAHGKKCQSEVENGTPGVYEECR
ncbi:lamin tail domain-containing protein [bacterium]|nr:lamin tail domain-containing protein [bacterium]